MARHYFSDTASTTSTLTSSINDSTTTVVVSTVSGFPGSFPYYAVIDRDGLSMEIVQVTNAAGTTLTVVRGISGTSGVAHSAGAAFEHCAPSDFYNDASGHPDVVTGIHGVAGHIVGTTDTQTLTNKTIDGASNTISNVPNSALDPTLEAMGNLTPGSNQMIYFSGGIDDAQVQNLSAFARTILDDANEAAVRGTINAQTAYANLSQIGVLTSGLIASTGAGTAAGRTLTASGSNVTITNGNGVSGNPTVAVAGKPLVSFSYGSVGTWTKPAGLVGIVLEMVGGGGGSGGCAATGAAQTSGSGGGQGGQYARYWIPAASLSASHAVTIGAGGGGGASGANSGSNGGSTTFGSLASVAGGEGGAGGGAAAISGASTTQKGGDAGQVTGGSLTADLAVSGDDGGTGVRINASQCAIPGAGGGSHWAGVTAVGAISGGQTAAIAGWDRGGGASGASNSGASLGAQPGAEGGDGYCVVTEYY